MNKKKKIYLFERDVAEKIASISNMPSCIATKYLPACPSVYAKHMASSIIAEDAVTEVRSVPSESIEIEQLDIRSIQELLLGDLALPNTDTAVELPMLTGNRFMLALTKEQKDLPENILSLINMHEKHLIWIPKKQYVELYGSTRQGEPIMFSPYRIEADEENINSMLYVAQLC